MMINYTDHYLETVVLDVPWDEGFVPPPEIRIYVETTRGHEMRVFRHRGDRPLP